MNHPVMNCLAMNCPGALQEADPFTLAIYQLQVNMGASDDMSTDAAARSPWTGICWVYQNGGT